MKREFSLFVAVLMLLASTFAYATGVEFSGGSTFHSYNDADSALGIGAKVAVKDVFVDGLSIRAGLERVNTEVDYQTGVPGTPFSGKLGFVTFTGKDASGNSAGAFDLGLTTASLEVGYDVKINDKLVVTPVIGPDFIFANAGGEFAADNTVGMHLGAELAYKVKDNIQIVAKAGYQVATVDASINAVGGTVAGGETELDLDNAYFGGEVKIAF